MVYQVCHKVSPPWQVRATNLPALINKDFAPEVDHGKSLCSHACPLGLPTPEQKMLDMPTVDNTMQCLCSGIHIILQPYPSVTTTAYHNANRVGPQSESTMAGDKYQLACSYKNSAPEIDHRKSLCSLAGPVT